MTMKSPRKIVIRAMRPEELKYIEQWSVEEGWNPGINDVACYSRMDMGGFMLAEADGVPAGCGVVLNFSDTFSSVGALIVRPEYRGGRVGVAIIRKGSVYIGKRTSFFDSVEEKVHSYMLFGGKTLYPIVRVGMKAVHAEYDGSDIVDLTGFPFERLMKYDSAFFPADRSLLMTPWIQQKPDGAALGILRNGELAGYGVIRKAYTGYRIEPFYAESPELAERLLLALLARVPADSPVYLNIPETNPNTAVWVRKYSMEPQFRLVRMYRGPKLPDCDVAKVYSVMG